MKTVTLYTRRMQLARQPQPAGLWRLVVMKGGIEAGDLRRAGQQAADCIDAGQVVRLVQRGKRCEAAQLLDTLAVEQDRCRELKPAMHDTMTDGVYLVLTETLKQSGQLEAEVVGTAVVFQLATLQGRAGSVIQCVLEGG